MTNRNVEDDKALEPQGDEDLAIGGIEDTTPDSQIEAEAKILAGETVNDDGDGDVEVPEARPTEPSEPVSDVPSEPEQPAPKYTDEDVERIRREVQSARDREVEQKLSAYQQQLNAFNKEAAVEAQLKGLAQALTQQKNQYGEPLMTPEEAQQRVFTPANRQAAEAEYDQKQQMAAMQSQQADAEQRQAFELLGDRVKQVRDTLQLDNEDVKMLLAQVPSRFDSAEHLFKFEEALTHQALSLYKRRGRGRVPNGAPNKQLSNGRSSGASETLEQRSLKVMEKPAWEWTEDDIKTMKQ